MSDSAFKFQPPNMKSPNGTEWSISIDDQGNEVRTPVKGVSASIGEVKNITDYDRVRDQIVASPRLRISLNRANPITLTNTWQTIPYATGNTPYDVNTSKESRYDAATYTIMPNKAISADQAYQIEMDFKFQHTKRPLTIQLRFHVPAPTPVDFPLPQTDGCTDLRFIPRVYALDDLLALVEDTRLMTNRETYIRSIYSSLGIKSYGVQIQVRIAENYTGVDRPQLTDAVLLMYPVS